MPHEVEMPSPEAGAVQQTAQQPDFSGMGETFKNIYDKCLEEYTREAAIWEEIQQATEIRMRPFSPNTVTPKLPNRSDPTRYWMLNRLGSDATEGRSYGSFSNFIEHTFQTVASGILSYVVPLPEYNVQYEFVGGMPDESITPTPVKTALTQLGKKVCQMFLDSNSGVHIHLLSAIKDLLRYGQCIIYDRFVGEQYMMQHLDLRDYMFDADPYTNEPYIIIRKLHDAQQGVHYHAWVTRKPWFFPQQGPEDSASYLKFVLDAQFNVIGAQPLQTMPIRVCRLFTIPGYKFGYGYGQSIINEARLMQKYTDARAITAMRSLKPPLEVYAHNYKDIVDPNTGKTLIEAIMNCDVVTRNPNVPPGTPLAAPIITHDPNSATTADQYIALIQQRIQETLMLSQYMLPQQPNMSAREVSVRAEQKLQLLTPVMSSVMNECVEPTIANITAQQMMIPNMSSMVIQNYRMQLMMQTGGMINLQLRHQTKFDRLRGLAEYNTGEDALRALTEGMQINPTVAVGINVDKLTIDRIKNTGVRQDIILSEQEKAEILQAQQEAAEAQQMQQAMQGLATTAARSQSPQ